MELLVIREWSVRNIGFCPGASKANVASSTSSLSAAAWAFPHRHNAGVINLLESVRKHSNICKVPNADMWHVRIYNLLEPSWAIAAWLNLHCRIFSPNTASSSCNSAPRSAWVDRSWTLQTTIWTRPSLTRQGIKISDIYVSMAAWHRDPGNSIKF